MENIFKSIKAKFEALPDKKRYLEFISALLSVPVLITVALLNLNSLKRSRQAENPVNPQPIKIEETKTSSLSPEITTPACKNEIGPIEIVYPAENQKAADNPFCLEIVYKDKTYCPVVWSYRINLGRWSDYTDRSICIYNLESGDKKLDLKVKSLTGDDEVILTREFIYQNKEVIPTPTELPTPTPLPSIEPSLTPTPIPASHSGTLQ